jgi:hypothetical protein
MTAEERIRELPGQRILQARIQWRTIIGISAVMNVVDMNEAVPDRLRFGK